MGKNFYKKPLSFILFIMLVLTYNTGISFAGTGITYQDSGNLIEKLSHSELGEGKTDGVLPEDGGDRANSYAWAMAQLDDNVYLGSNRNILAGAFLQVNSDPDFKDLALKFLDDISDGDIPTDDIDDNEARMFRYDIKHKTFEQIYKDPSITGYRSAMTFTPEEKADAGVYFGTLGPVSKVLRFEKDFKAGDDPEVVFSAIPGYASIRAMTAHEDSMCIGVLTIASDDTEGNLQIMQATDPAIGNWTEIASIDDFAPCSPRTDAGAAAQSGVWDMVSYNGSIYAFIGTGYVKESETNGYSVFKGTYLPGDENSNGAGWVWKMIVGPMEDGEGNPTGAKYPRGMGNQYDGSASPFLYTDPDGETYVYAGTFDSIFESIFEILSTQSYESLYRAMHPAKIYRFDENDDWEMVIGNPDEYFNEKLGNYYAGFSDSTEGSVYSPNLYVWRMAQYDGELFAGTFDGTTLMDYIVPPLNIDFENYDYEDLLTILEMAGFSLPDQAVNALSEAIDNMKAVSAAAVEAKNIYLESEVVAAAGEDALEAAEAAYALVPNYTSGDEITTSGLLYDAMTDCEERTTDFAKKATDAAVSTTLAAATAGLSAIASESAADAVADWEYAAENHITYNDDITDNIYNVRDDVSSAVVEARSYRDKAKSDMEEAGNKVGDAIAAINDARENLIDISKDFKELFGTITVEQYSKMSAILLKLNDLGYGSDEMQELRYIFELRAMINTNKEAGGMGCSVYRTSDGLNFTPVTTNGFEDKYNYGLRTFLPTNDGLFMGMANPFYGAQLWKLGDLKEDDDGGHHGGGGGGSSKVTILEEEVPLGALTLGALNLTDHFAYVLGYEDGTIRPQNSMTRAEIATVFYRLLTEESRKLYQSGSSGFSDVSSSDWFNTAVSTLVNANVLTGYSGGKFMPGAYVTRAEFATILSRFTEAEIGSSAFTDIGGHWAKDSINTAYAKGWVTGYNDNTFRPNQVVTRAEVMTMVNRVLQRAVKAGNMLDGMTTWSDNPADAWYFEAVQEATNSHDYKRTGEPVSGQSYYYENWTELTNASD